MKLCIKKLKYSGSRDMRTEVLYENAAARAAGYSVIRYDLPEESQTSNVLTKILRAEKKQGKIEFFIGRDAFLEDSTAARFLLNVCPECLEASESDERYLFVKL